jgi:hypothetical protein
MNRIEAAMYIERRVKDSLKFGDFDLQPKAIAHAEGTNMVCPLPVHSTDCLSNMSQRILVRTDPSL